MNEKNIFKIAKAYYPTYLEAHQNIMNRRLHFAGQLFTIWFAYYVLSNFIIFLIPLIPFVIYPIAWFGHLKYEKNKPATWTVSPLITKTCDWMMFFDILRGKVKIF